MAFKNHRGSQEGLVSQPSFSLQNTLDEVQGGKPFGSMSLDELIQGLFHDPNAKPAPQALRPAYEHYNSMLPGHIPSELRTKSISEAWSYVNQISGGQLNATQLQGKMTVGDYVSRVLTFSAPAFQTMVPYSQIRDVRAVQRAAKDRKKRAGEGKAIFSVNDDIAKKQKRMVKNRESAARSRLRKQQYTEELEKQVELLKAENEQLRKKLIECGVSHKDNDGNVASDLRSTKS